MGLSCKSESGHPTTQYTWTTDATTTRNPWMPHTTTTPDTYHTWTPHTTTKQDTYHRIATPDPWTPDTTSKLPCETDGYGRNYDDYSNTPCNQGKRCLHWPKVHAITTWLLHSY